LTPYHAGSDSVCEAFPLVWFAMKSPNPDGMTMATSKSPASTAADATSRSVKFEITNGSDSFESVPRRRMDHIDASSSMTPTLNSTGSVRPKPSPRRPMKMIGNRRAQNSVPRSRKNIFRFATTHCGNPNGSLILESASR
jgi:hypothetical protein